MKTMTTITAAEKTASGSYVAYVLGGEKLGTKDAELGEKLLAIFAKDPEHCMCDIEYDVTPDRMYLTGIEYIDAPDVLGGPDDKAPAPSDAPTPVAATEPDFTLEQLLTLSTRLTKVEEFLALKGFEA